MAANVENMFYVGREVPWHGLGVSVEEAPTSQDALHYAGLDWQVVQKPVLCQQSDTIHTPVDGFVCNVRSSDNKPLGIVTERYKVVQNEEAFAFTDALLGEGVRYETAGSLAGGKRIWMLARMPQDYILADEKVNSYLCFSNTHDGSGAVKVCITPIRVVCQNTLNLALSQAERMWSMCHKGDVQGKLEEARRTLLNTETYMKQLGTEMEKLKLQKLTDDKLDEYIELLIPLDDSKSTRTQDNVTLMRTQIRSVYNDAPDLQCVEKSAFRFINAVSDWATHREPIRRTQNYQANLFEKTIDGNAFIDRAYQIMKAAA